MRPASVHDRHSVVALTRHERHVHTHLDWQPPEDWLGRRPFQVVEQGRRVLAVLACPPDPPDTSWLRVFAVNDKLSPEEAWEALWEPARAELEEMGVPVAAALSMEDWLPALLEAADFRWTHDVVGFSRRDGLTPTSPQVRVELRPAEPGDLPALTHLDGLCFQQPWQLSQEALRMALARAAVATVAVTPSGEQVGYQISTASHHTGHLARLAVHPARRGEQIGTALVVNALQRLSRARANWVTVNTQSDNAASIALYRRLGFDSTPDRFPVFQLSPSQSRTPIPKPSAEAVR